MEMHPLPFTPKTLALAIAAGLLVSQSVTKAHADSPPENEWICTPDAQGGWSCGSAPKKKSAIKRSPLPAEVVTVNNIAPGMQKDTAKKVSAKTRTAPPATETVAVSPAQTALRKTLDWVPASQLTPAQRAGQQFYSCGAYIEPERPGKDFKGNPDTQPIHIDADDVKYDQESIARLNGNVTLRQANRLFEGDNLTLNKLENTATFRGNTRVREPGLLVLGQYGSANLNTGEATVDDAAYVVHASNVRGQAKRVVRNGDATIELTDATYTSCPPSNNGWLLSGQKVRLNPNTGFGSATNATVKVHGIPVLYTPYIYFPIDDRRQSGFLYPTIGSSSNNGFDASVPYYFNLAPNYDATLTPRIMSKRGAHLEGQARYLTAQNKGEIGAAALAGKDALKKENRYYDQQRWLISWNHTTTLTPRWTMGIDYANASDKQYIDDFGTQLNLSSSGPLNQRVGTKYLGGDADHDWQLKLDAHKFKNMSETSDDPYDKLPQIELKGTWFTAAEINVNYLVDYTRFSRSDNWHYVNEVPDPDFNPGDDVKKSLYDQGYGIERAEGDRAYFESGASFPFTASYGFITPAVKVQHVQYSLTNLNKQEVIDDLKHYGFKEDDYTKTPSTTVPTFSLDSGLYFDRQITFEGTAYTHTFEPRVKYLYAPSVEGQAMNPVFDTALMDFTYSSLWRDSRFTGYDRLGDANQLSIGFSSSLLREKDGFERLRFALGQTLYFKDRDVYIDPRTGEKNKIHWDINEQEQYARLKDEMEEPTSPLVSELVYTINRASSVQQDLAWNTNSNQLDNYGIYYRYHPQSRKVFNIGYRFRSQADRYVKDEFDNNVIDSAGHYETASNDLSLSDVSVAWPINNQWSALGRWQYDFTNKRNFEVMSGIEYNSCCYQLRVLWRSWIEPDDNIDHPTKKSGVFLQFVLRGLGGLSSGSVSNYLSGIQGYEQDEK